jgi:hypothetical protein
MEMSPVCGVPGVDDEDHKEDDAPSILCGIQCGCSIVSRGWLLVVMWSRKKERVRPCTPQQTFRIAAFLFIGGGPMPS